MLTRHIQAPRTVDTCVKEICNAIMLCYIILFNNCSALVHVFTMIHVFIDWNSMEVMASAKHCNYYNMLLAMLKVF